MDLEPQLRRLAVVAAHPFFQRLRPGEAADAFRVGNHAGDGATEMGSDPISWNWGLTPFQCSRRKKLSAHTATPATAATGAMYCTTSTALCPPDNMNPAASGPRMEPTRPTPTLAPEPVPRMV